MEANKVIIFRNGTNSNSEKISLPESHFDILEYASKKYSMNATKIFISDGTEVHEVSFLRNNDIIYISEGEDFKQPPKQNQSEFVNNSEWITLNVGGKLFTTSRSTLTTKEPESMLARMFAGDKTGYLFTPSNIDKNGAYLIDRSPEYFEPILNYLRNGQLIYDKHVNPEGILIEAQFFGIESVIPTLQEIVSIQNQNVDNQALTRREVIDALIRSAYNTELRFQGVNLAGADLSKLDLRNINFKYANLQGCKLTLANLSYCCLERADLSHANLDGAHLLGVKCLCANLEGVSMQNSNFKDPSGVRATLEGVNLKGANLEGSDLGGVNLRVATLKNANLKNCDLRAAVLAGADLEYCDLSGSDLHEANLRGANLKFAVFELMLTPLHMSQTIR